MTYRGPASLAKIVSRSVPLCAINRVEWQTLSNEMLSAESPLSRQYLSVKAKTLQGLSLAHESVSVLQDAFAAILHWVQARSLNDTFAYYTSTRVRARAAISGGGQSTEVVRKQLYLRASTRTQPSDVEKKSSLLSSNSQRLVSESL